MMITPAQTLTTEISVAVLHACGYRFREEQLIARVDIKTRRLGRTTQ